MEISLAAEKLFSLGPIDVTNSLLSAFLILIVLLFVVLVAGSRIRFENPGKFQLFLEMIVDGFKGIAIDIVGKSKAQKLFGFVFTFFIFIVLSNWFGLLPFVSSVVIEHPGNEHEEEIHTLEGAHALEAEESGEEAHEDSEVSFGACIKERDCILTSNGIERKEAFPVFRAPTSDVSATIALALVAVFSIHILGFSSLGFGHLKKYINFSSPIDGFVGILELISEIGKIISFAFRLFGNIFAGEVLLLVITNISFGIATLPFLLLEVFVGFIQAFVFFMLVLVFMSLATQSHEH